MLSYQDDHMNELVSKLATSCCTLSNLTVCLHQCYWCCSYRIQFQMGSKNESLSIANSLILSYFVSLICWASGQLDSLLLPHFLHSYQIYLATMKNASFDIILRSLLLINTSCFDRETYLIIANVLVTLPFSLMTTMCRSCSPEILVFPHTFLQLRP